MKEIVYFIRKYSQYVCMSIECGMFWKSQSGTAKHCTPISTSTITIAKTSLFNEFTHQSGFWNNK